MKDKWLSTPNTFQVQSPILTLHENVLAQDLLIDDRKAWNVSLIHALFQEDEVETILAMPISMRGGIDKLIQGLTADGSFSIKSVYATSLAMKSTNVGEASNALEHTGLWKSIWSLTIPEKVNFF